MQEESISFNVSKKIFYNPAMQFCRSMSSLAVGAIAGSTQSAQHSANGAGSCVSGLDEMANPFCQSGTNRRSRLEVVDAFCASGIRGIRYAKENKNVKRVTFIDIDPTAIALAKKNAKQSKMKAKFVALKGNVSRLAFDVAADFVEIDPFGTPSPYLVDALRFLRPVKVGYLSATATDVAVLCGGKTAACMKNYHSKPLNNEFTHETGLRILIKRIAEVAAEFNLGITPLVSFSDRHYLKTIVRLDRSAEAADNSLRSLGYVSYCSSCGFRSVYPFGQFPKEQCENCLGGQNKTKPDFTGPLWLGELHDGPFIERMARLNDERDYADRESIAKMLSLMEGEIGMPPYYYNVHEFCKKHGLVSIPKMETIIERLRSAGYLANRTHFSDISIKTNAGYAELVRTMRA